MEYFYLTDPGRAREKNEDSVIITENYNKEILMVVADGMGGHRNGEIASSIALAHISKRFKDLSSIGTKEEAIKWIEDAVKEANFSLYKYTEENPESEGMGTTLVLAIITSSFLLFGNIGDSSGYVIKDEKLHKVTIDHTLVNLLVNSGELTEEEARNHPRKNVLMRALGASSTVEMDIFDITDNYEGVLLASDGLTNMLDNATINKVLNEKSNIEDKVRKLIVKSNNRGGTDNISIAYFTKEAE